MTGMERAVDARKQWETNLAGSRVRGTRYEKNRLGQHEASQSRGEDREGNRGAGVDDGGMLICGRGRVDDKGAELAGRTEGGEEMERRGGRGRGRE